MYIYIYTICIYIHTYIIYIYIYQYHVILYISTSCTASPGPLFPTEPEWFAEERGVALGALAVLTINARGFCRFHINGYIW